MADQADGLFSPFLRKRRIAAVRPFLSGRILDFGCGIGVLAGLVPARDYLGVDRDELALSMARANHPGHRFQQTLPDAGAFDTIVGVAVIEHLPRPQETLACLKRLLSPAGSMVLTSPHPAFESAYKIGARAGLFSQTASDEHESFINKPRMREIAAGAGLEMAGFRRFLLSANQLFVLRRAKSS